jgi:hypothetical protein
MVITSCIASFFSLGYFKGLGIATILSAVFVGKLLSYLQKHLGARIRAFGIANG